jgi:hypothetical protein
VSSAVAQIHAAVDRLRCVGRAEGIEVDGPLGQWLDAQAEALSGLADVLQVQGERIDETLGRIEGNAAMELRNLREAIEAANHVVRQGEFAMRQARQMQVGVVVERQHLVEKMVTETLPMFAEKLNEVWVIREKGWNVEARDRRFAIAAAVAMSIFMAGYFLSWWQDSGQLAAFNRCLAHPVQAGGHLYCAGDGLFGTAKALAGSHGS